MKVRRFFALVLVGTLWGCSHKNVAPVASGDVSSPKEKALYEQGVRFLSKKDYSDAAQNFSDLLTRFPNTPRLIGATYNWGLALEGQGQYGEAAGKYKKVVEWNQGRHSREEAEALYRLSICYEALNEDPKMILALLQLQNLGSLNRDTMEVEVPARLAAAYARQGNTDIAHTDFAKAESGLKRIRANRGPSPDLMIWLPKTLYSMGHMPSPKKEIRAEEFSNYVASLSQAQIWLVKAAEMGENPWAKKAAEELTALYSDSWAAIDRLPVPGNEADRLQALKSRQDDQRAMAASLDSAISKLKLERLPPSPREPEPPSLTAAFQSIGGIQKRLDILLEQPYVQDQPTLESQKREGLRRQGMIKDGQ